MADAGHGGQELLQAGGIGVEGVEEIGAARPDLVLRLPGAERLREMAPEGVEALVGHLEDPAHVRRLVPIEEQVRLGSIRIAVTGAGEESERDQCVQEVARRARMEPQPAGERGERFRSLRELREDFHLDRAQ